MVLWYLQNSCSTQRIIVFCCRNNIAQPYSGDVIHKLSTNPESMKVHTYLGCNHCLYHASQALTFSQVLNSKVGYEIVCRKPIFILFNTV